jgi:hypothetical protein
MSQTIHRGDLHVDGDLTSRGFRAAAGSITDDAVQAGADISAAKLEHQYQPVYSQGMTTTPAADRRVIHIARGATGTFTEFAIGTRVALTGDSTITVDLLKNGSTILTGTVGLSNAESGYGKKTATIATSTYVAGDVFEVVVTVSAGTGSLGQGLYAVATLREEAQ